MSISRKKSHENLEQSWSPYRRLLKLLSQSTHIPSYLLNNYARTLFFLILLNLIFPFHLLITLLTYIISYLLNLIFSKKKSLSIVNPHSKRILISGGRTTAALHLSRAFARVGHQIVLIDEEQNWLTGHRWSNSVERFYVHPSPMHESDHYRHTLANIVRKEKIDLFIPVTSSLRVDSQVEKKNSKIAFECISSFSDRSNPLWQNMVVRYFTKGLIWIIHMHLSTKLVH